MPIYHHPTPIGTAVITEQDGYITAISVNGDDQPTNIDAPNQTLLTAIEQLDEYFAGKRLVFDLPLKPEGTRFQQEVWQHLQTIPFGSTVTYTQQSRQMQQPLAIRAIAAANGKNKLWIVIPCHRVIGSGGELTGYAGEIWRKKWLLEHEAKIAGVGQLSLLL
ncbi:methylated-DNA--[protein]-cysteine S-methyltransferase [Mucilaginibacter sp. CSA2-8R]|uniref:methylated-DNA--[protein]-cysteine S-methyltransferase n=1 Tax=Mucilaginibacter sp. CSA2-8R TaxID=3141542 RepID=UPI00315D26F5